MSQFPTGPRKPSAPSSLLHIDLTVTPWGKRLAFLTIWLLILFRTSIVSLLSPHLNPPWPHYLELLISTRGLVMVAFLAVLVAARFRFLDFLVQGVYFWLFLPIALIYTVYRSIRVVLRLPLTTHRFLTSHLLHIVLWPLTTLATVAVLAGWAPRLLPVSLGLLVFAILILLSIGFLFAFSPGSIHRAVGRVALELSRSIRQDVDQRISSGDYERDEGSRKLKTNEVVNYSEWTARLHRHFKQARDPKRAVRIFVEVLPLLLGAIVFLFAVAFVAVDQLSVDSFQGQAHKGFLDFFLFSVANMFAASLPGLVPTSYLAKGLAALQIACGVAVAIVLLLVVTAFSPSRYAEELVEAVDLVQKAQSELNETLSSIRRLDKDASS